jgi:hypothetical protein
LSLHVGEFRRIYERKKYLPNQKAIIQSFIYVLTHLSNGRLRAQDRHKKITNKIDIIITEDNIKAKHYNKIQFSIEIKRTKVKRFYIIIINISKTHCMDNK